MQPQMLGATIVTRHTAGARVSGMLLAACALAATLTSDAGSSSVGRAPKIEFVETIHDFGVVKQGATHAHRFVFHNRGHADLKVSSPPLYPVPAFQTVSPGDKSSVEIRLSTGSRRGPLVRRFTVLTNDPSNSRAILEVRAEVRVPIEILPSRRLCLGAFRPREGTTRTVTLAAVEQADLRITRAETDSRLLAVDLAEKKTHDGRRSYEATISVLPGAPYGPFAGKVVFHTNHREMPTVEVVLSGTASSGVTISPSAMRLGVVRRGQAIRRSVRVSVLKRKEWVKVLDVARDHPVFEVERDRNDSVGDRVAARGVSYAFRLRVKADAPTGPITEGIKVFVNDPERPYFLVPVHGAVASSFRLVPSGIFFNLPADKGQMVGTIRIAQSQTSLTPSDARSAREPALITKVECDERVFNVQFRPARGEPGAYALSVTLAKSLGDEPVVSEIKLHTSEIGEPVLVIPVRAVKAQERRPHP